jgi:SAM-dependent methyltransferase
MTTSYVLGSDPAELARLDAQAASLAAATRMLLHAAGLRPGMRVLDLGTGLGHVAFAAAEIVGPQGEVVGIDASEAHLAVARERNVAGNVRFVHADVRDHRDDAPFDAVVCRLLLFHMADPLAVVRHHVHALVSGGRFVALDYDIAPARAEPPVALVHELIAWVGDAFRAAGADPTIGAELPRILPEAGLQHVESLAVQRYYSPGDPAGTALLMGVVRTLGGPERARELPGAAREAVMMPPALVGAWGVRG